MHAREWRGEPPDALLRAEQAIAPAMPTYASDISIDISNEANRRAAADDLRYFAGDIMRHSPADFKAIVWLRRRE